MSQLRLTGSFMAAAVLLAGLAQIPAINPGPALAAAPLGRREPRRRKAAGRAAVSRRTEAERHVEPGKLVRQ